eukprot:tig00000042_g15616.t1
MESTSFYPGYSSIGGTTLGQWGSPKANYASTVRLGARYPVSPDSSYIVNTEMGDADAASRERLQIALNASRARQRLRFAGSVKDADAEREWIHKGGASVQELEPGYLPPHAFVFRPELGSHQAHFIFAAASTEPELFGLGVEKSLEDLDRSAAAAEGAEGGAGAAAGGDAVSSYIRRRRGTAIDSLVAATAAKPRREEKEGEEKPSLLGEAAGALGGAATSLAQKLEAAGEAAARATGLSQRDE